jgi:electron transport complex protein RnfA
MILGAAVGAYALEDRALRPAHLEYLRTLALLGMVAALTLLVRAVIGRAMPTAAIVSLRFIETLTSNAASLGVALFSALHMNSLGAALQLGLGCGLGFAFAVATFAPLRERIGGDDVPRAMRGPPISLVTAGIMALALLGLSGLIKV